MPRDGTEAAGSVIGCLILLAFNLTVGALCFDYVLFTVFGKDVPWYADMAAGLLLGQFALPAAIICWVVRLCGVPVPFIG